jgi:hypothetical protein
MRETSVRILLTVLESIIGKMEINLKETTKME